MSEISKSILSPENDAAVCTLFEKDYHFGVAALLNSLVHAGFAGTVWAGYRGSLPPWLDQLRRGESHADEYWVTDRVRIVFLEQDASIHFTNYKPGFMLNLLANEARDWKYLWYFDPDIYVCAKWSFFADWQSNGVALCQEIANNILPPDSPLRQTWIKVASSIGLQDPKPQHYYYNAGFIGVPKESAGFLETWKQVLEFAGTKYCDLRNITDGDTESPFNFPDQNALNIAAMYSQYPLSTLGPQGMGFIRGAVIMYHTPGPKPWRGSLLMSALKGMPPSDGFKYYFTQVSSPIRMYTPGALAAKRLACKTAAFIGRFYRRG